MQHSKEAFPGSGHQTPLEEESCRLKRELERVQQERDILKRGMLLRRAFCVSHTWCSDEVLTGVEHSQPDLILLDFKFGHRQIGWDFLQKLTLHCSTKPIPHILCTAVASSAIEPHEAQLLQQGIPILYKPFDIDGLLELVHRCLARSPVSSRCQL
jgi:CheY-like chemotaxis protein